jgi:hypothetical protein
MAGPTLSAIFRNSGDGVWLVWATAVGAGVAAIFGVDEAEGLAVAAGTDADAGVGEDALVWAVAVVLELYRAMAMTMTRTAQKNITWDLFIWG